MLRLPASCALNADASGRVGVLEDRGITDDDESHSTPKDGEGCDLGGAPPGIPCICGCLSAAILVCEGDDERGVSCPL